jgi:hypothetical protein
MPKGRIERELGTNGPVVKNPSNVNGESDSRICDLLFNVVLDYGTIWRAEKERSRRPIKSRPLLLLAATRTR